MVAALAILVGIAFKVSWDKSDLAQCHELQSQSVKFAPSFFLSVNEKQMCDELGVEISAPVGDPYEKQQTSDRVGNANGSHSVSAND